jgi:hypothetical protein
MKQTLSDTEVERFEIQDKYYSVVQIDCLLADTTNLIGEIGRGSGKTTHMFSPRLIRISYDMPRSIILLAAPTYVFIMDTIVPGIISYLAKNYIRGYHYEYGKEPPKHFYRPYTPVMNWKHTISFAWGTVVQFISLDRPESAIGKNSVHIFVDEMLRMEETDFIERILPTLREDRELFGHSHYFGGITCFSSTPNFENDYDWWLKYSENVNKEAVEEIKYVAYRVLESEGRLTEIEKKLLECYEDPEKIKLEKKIDDIEPLITKYKVEIVELKTFIEKWSNRLREKRKEDKGRWYYMKGSSYSNFLILGSDFFKRLYAGARSNFKKFMLAILGIRPRQVKEMFFARFTKKHVFKDSYLYSEKYDDNTVAGEYKHTSSDLKHCDPNKPLLMGFDPGNFMSIVVAQEKQNIFRPIKDFCVWTPRSHFEMAQEIDTFFKPHKLKIIRIWCDRAAFNHVEKYKQNTKGRTDAAILKRELEDLGWRVEIMNPNQRTIEYWEHFLLLDLLLGERDKRAPKIKICQFECERLISCIYMSPLKRVKGSGIELDKSSEVKLDYEEQQWYSTQLPSSLMYLIFGLYEKFKPSKYEELPGFNGL